MEAASSALSRGPSGALRRRWRCILSPIADGGVRPQGGRGPSGGAGRKRPCSACVFRAGARPLRRCCATSPPLRGREEESVPPCQRPDHAARGARAVPRRTWGPSGGEVARSAGRGPGDRMGVWEFRLPTLGTLRGAGWTGGLASGDCPPSAGCRTRRLVRVAPARRAPPTRTRRARAHPTRPRTLRFSSPRRHTPARPTHAAASGADPGRPPHAAGSRGTMRPAGRAGDNSGCGGR